MSDVEYPRHAADPSEAGEAGIEFWRATDLVSAYDRSDLRPVEAMLLQRHRDVLAGRVLEIGVGAGRVTRYLCPIARELHGIDISPAMVRRAATVCPDATLVVRDLREIGVYGQASFDAVVASFNVIDVLDHHDREQLFDTLARILVPGGLLLFSSHNRGASGTVRGPVGKLVDDVGHLRVKEAVADVVRLPRRLSNRARMRRLEHDGSSYSIVNDVAHDYALAQYYIDRDEQARQLERHGFRLEACYDLSGASVPAGARAEGATELTYVAFGGEPISTAG